MDDPYAVPPGVNDDFLRYAENYGAFGGYGDEQNPFVPMNDDWTQWGAPTDDGPRGLSAWSGDFTTPGAPPPFESSSKSSAASSVGYDTTYSYVDWNRALNKSTVGVSIVSEILSLYKEGEEVRLLRDLGAVPVTGGRHQLKSHESVFRDASGFAGFSTVVPKTSQGWLILTTDTTPFVAVEMLVSELVNADPRSCLLKVFEASNRTTFNPLQLTSTQALLPGDVIPDKYKFISTPVLNRLSGYSAKWHRAQVFLDQTRITSSTTARGWAWILGTLGGFMSLFSTVATVLVGVALFATDQIKKRSAKRAAGEEHAPGPNPEPAAATAAERGGAGRGADNAVAPGAYAGPSSYTPVISLPPKETMVESV